MNEIEQCMLENPEFTQDEAIDFVRFCKLSPREMTEEIVAEQGMTVSEWESTVDRMCEEVLKGANQHV